MATQTDPGRAVPPVGVLGQGRAGRDLVSLLRGAGIPVGLIWARPAPLPRPIPASTVVLAVPDTAIADLATAVAARGVLPDGAVVIHLSGALDAGALGACAGHPAASAHPLQTFLGDGHVRLPFPWVVEGHPVALARARELIGLLGCDAIELDRAGKVRYHAAATIASNLLVALADLASQQARLAGIQPTELPGLFAPLMHATIDHLARHGAAEALTGPVARGDRSTVAAHLEALTDEPADRELYRQLSLRLLPLAAERGLGADRIQRLRALLAPIRSDCDAPEDD